MSKFTREEVEAAKRIRDFIIQGNIHELKHVYSAGEICMWDELHYTAPSTKELIKDCERERYPLLELSTPPVSATDMTAQEFFNHPDGMFTLDFLTKEEQETLYKAIDLFAAGKVRQAILSAPVSAMEDGWRTGYTLITNNTKHWSKDAIDANNEIEGRMVFKNFHESDYGKSRVLLCICETRQQAETIVSEHNKLLTTPTK